ncbi:MAG: exodeoxyribonuclease VII large subunit, partial [Alphaproteobacteria bacterium]
MTNLIPSQSDSLSNQPIYSVADLSNAVKRAIESNFEFVRVRGEISKPAFPGSGHIYFSLKDVNVTLASVIWKGQLSQINIQPEEGMDVICTGKLTTFAGQSRYQLNVTQIEFAGEGALLKQLEALRQRLQAEGLFSEDRKQEIPYLPSV